MDINGLLKQLDGNSAGLQFAEVLAAIEAAYHYTPQTFYNGLGDGRLLNQAGSNEGSCKVFAFGQLQGLSEQQTLACFAEHYRKVLSSPEGSDHGNIRAFMKYGWAGVAFEGTALSPV